MSLSFVKTGAIAAAVIFAGLAVTSTMAEAKPLGGEIQYDTKVKSKPWGYTTGWASEGDHVWIIGYEDNGTKTKKDDWVHVLAKGDYNGWVQAYAVDFDNYKPWNGPNKGPKNGVNFCFNGPFGYFCASN
jgi:hypothetical protein